MVSYVRIFDGCGRGCVGIVCCNVGDECSCWVCVIRGCLYSLFIIVLGRGFVSVVCCNEWRLWVCCCLYSLFIIVCGRGYVGVGDCSLWWFLVCVVSLFYSLFVMVWFWFFIVCYIVVFLYLFMLFLCYWYMDRLLIFFFG